MAKIELLAPAGSFESMEAAIAAGADAVYMGGTRFGARAYAENPEEDRLLEAISYVHLHGRKLYLTVNTLLKEDELEQSLYDYLLPLYQAGLDAVIVQDMGVMERIRQWFPDLPIHASTQMTMTGPGSAALLYDLGVSRVVTPRELTMEEICQIQKSCPIEIEVFVHGALCYCYSGQCLYSSLAGGRSGNRGRCAQPCRMEYQHFTQEEGGKSVNPKEEAYLLSPKDMNTLDLLPELIEAGVHSLKIEGRMKKPVYAAGVTAIYRKYIDRYEALGKEGYFVEQQDRQRLWDLFNRKGFTEGYFHKHNGRDMITLTKPDFRPGNDVWIQSLQTQYIDTKLQEKVKGNVTIRQHLPVTMELECRGIHVACQGDMPQKAEKQPATRESIEKQIRKFGGTSFCLEELRVEIEDGLFVPVGALNALRRQTIKELEEALTGQYVRECSQTVNLRTGKFQWSDSAGCAESQPWQPKEECFVGIPEGISSAAMGEEEITNLSFRMQQQSAIKGIPDGDPFVSVSVETLEQLDAVLDWGDCHRIYIDSLITSPARWKELADRIHAVGSQAFLAMPRIFRTHARNYFQRFEREWEQAGFDGILVRTIEELTYFKSCGYAGILTGDHMLYAYNNAAEAFYKKQGIAQVTIPVELNAAEWKHRGIEGAEVLLYGRLPMMVSAQCLKKTTGKCNHKEEITYLQDRTRVRMPVKSVCPYCYNVIYNGYAMSLLEEWQNISAMHPGSLRLSFSVETKEETLAVLKGWSRTKAGLPANITGIPLTKGHFRRGVM